MPQSTIVGTVVKVRTNFLVKGSILVEVDVYSGPSRVLAILPQGDASADALAEQYGNLVGRECRFVTLPAAEMSEPVPTGIHADRQVARSIMPLDGGTIQVRPAIRDVA